MGTSNQDPPPLKRQNRRLIAENRMFEIYFDHVIAEDHTEVPEYLVVVPKRKTADGITGVAILPVINGKIPLLKIYRHPVDSWSWEIPRGFVENGEDTLESVARELEEETGLQCRRENIRSLGIIDADAGTLCAKIQLFVGENCETVRPFAPEEMGHLEMKFFTENEIYQMIEHSEIRDPSTLIAFYKYVNK
jgi:8-oxo-dGTP pyrophosphatase MutT (NUDIX family)